MGICLRRLNDPSQLLRVRDGRRVYLPRRIVGRRGFQPQGDSLDFLLLDLRRLRGVLRLRRSIQIRRLCRQWGVWGRQVWRLQDDKVGRRMGWELEVLLRVRFRFRGWEGRVWGVGFRYRGSTI